MWRFFECTFRGALLVDAGDSLCKDLLNLQVLSKQSVKSRGMHAYVAVPAGNMIGMGAK